MPSKPNNVNMKPYKANDKFKQSNRPALNKNEQKGQCQTKLEQQGQCQTKQIEQQGHCQAKQQQQRLSCLE